MEEPFLSLTRVIQEVNDEELEFFHARRFLRKLFLDEAPPIPSGLARLNEAICTMNLPPPLLQWRRKKGSFHNSNSYQRGLMAGKHGSSLPRDYDLHAFPVKGEL